MFRTRHPRLVALARISAVVGGLLVSGCTVRRPIYPTELPKLNDTGTSSGSSSGRPVIVLTIKQLRSTDGMLFEVKGSTSVYITNLNREEFEFEPPINVKINGDTLTIASRYRPPMTFDRKEIFKVEVDESL